MRLQLENFDLEVSRIEIDTFSDPGNPLEGHMIIRVEGAIGTTSERLRLIEGVVPHARQQKSNLFLADDDIPENCTVVVKPKMQSIPANHRFVLVWETETPYFVGVQSGEKYRL